MATHPRLLVLGGSGRMGQLVVDEALQRGFSVTALVRKSTSLEPRESLIIVEGSPLNKSDIENAFMAVSGESKTVAISALGQQRTSGSPWSAPISPPSLVADSIANLLTVGKDHGLQKVVMISMFGAGKSMTNLNFAMRWIMNHSNMVQTVDDHNLADERLRESGTSFVMIRAAMLMGEQARAVKVLNDNGENAGWFPSLSTRSLAAFLMDTVVQDEWNGRSPVVTN